MDFRGKGVSNSDLCIAAHAVRPASVLQDVITNKVRPAMPTFAPSDDQNPSCISCIYTKHFMHLHTITTD